MLILSQKVRADALLFLNYLPKLCAITDNTKCHFTSKLFINEQNFLKCSMLLFSQCLVSLKNYHNKTAYNMSLKYLYLHIGFGQIITAIT